MNDPLQLSLSVDLKSNIANPEAILSPSPLVTGETRSQDFTNYYRVNGGFYIAWMKKFLDKEKYNIEIISSGGSFKKIKSILGVDQLFCVIFDFCPMG